ncbi:MAG: PAS domain S-box protein [Synechocystis sp.]|nr:PAS domain S-box protein [Synechocystis sp.]
MSISAYTQIKQEYRRYLADNARSLMLAKEVLGPAIPSVDGAITDAQRDNVLSLMKVLSYKENINCVAVHRNTIQLIYPPADFCESMDHSQEISSQLGKSGSTKITLFISDQRVTTWNLHILRFYMVWGTLLLLSVQIAIYFYLLQRKKVNDLLQDMNQSLEKKVEEKTKDLLLQQRAINAAQDGIIILDALSPELPCISVNPSFEKITGYEASEVLGENFHILLGPDIDQPGLNVLRKSLKEQKSCEVLFRNYRKNGDVFWNNLSVSPIFNEQGKLTHYVGIQNDVSERIKSELAMRRQSDAMNAAVDGISILKGDRFIYVNSSFAKLFGYENEQALIGVSWKALYPPKEIKNFESNILPILHANGHWQGVVNAMGKDGSTFSEGLSISLKNNVIIHIGRDITPLKKYQNEIESSLKQKEILLREIHHRIKNNLLVVSSMINWQSDFFDDPRVIAAMEDSQNRIRSMALIHEKLYGSPNLMTIDLADYLKTLVDEIYASSQRVSSKVEIRFELQPVFVNIETATPCGLIVNELILNALEHGFEPDRGGTILVAMGIDEKQRISVRVKDDGMGMPQNFDWREAESLGLQLVCLLTEQLEGALNITQDNGVDVIITFEELHYEQRI